MPDRADYASDITLIDHLVALKLVPDWGAIEATDIDMVGFATATTGTDTILLDYTNNTGFTLLIYDWSAGIWTGDGQLYGALFNVSLSTLFGSLGGARGFAEVFSKPKRIENGQRFQVIARQDTGSNQDLLCSVGMCHI